MPVLCALLQRWVIWPSLILEKLIESLQDVISKCIHPSLERHGPLLPVDLQFDDAGIDA